MSTTRDQAELAKAKAFDLLAGVPGLNGIGIAVLGDGYGVKVNLTEATAHAAIPSEIGGVPVVVEIIGIISAD